MSFVIDLDAQRREVQHPHGIPVKFGGEQFIFPAELPADALDPILSDELDLVGFLVDVMESADGDAGASEIMAALVRRPTLLRLFLAAIRETYAILLGEQHDAFLKAKPFLGDYVRLTVGLAKVYGVELGKLFRSGDSSESDGATSSQTSPDSTESTPAASGSAQDTPNSSDSDG